MYENVVKRLRWLAFSFPHTDEPKCESDKICNCINLYCTEAADAIEELSREIDAGNAAMTAMDAAMPRVIALFYPWIPVTEEPPLEVGDDGYNGYLVYANGYYEVADYTTDKFDNVPCFHVNGEYEPDVTHYMPLPDPPKKDKP